MKNMRNTLLKPLRVIQKKAENDSKAVEVDLSIKIPTFRMVDKLIKLPVLNSFWEMTAMTLSEAKNLNRDHIIYSRRDNYKDGTPRRWKINGKVKVWKRNPLRVQVPLKQGLYTYNYLTEKNLNQFSLGEYTNEWE